MAFFRPNAPASASAETAVVPPTAPKSTGVTLDKQGAQNSNLGSVSGVMESMVTYFDGKFAEIHKKLGLQDRQMEQIESKLGSELNQIKQQLGKQQEKQQKQQQPALPASFREAKTPEDLLVCFPCLRKAGDFMWCSVCTESPQNGHLLEHDVLPVHGNFDATQPFPELKKSARGKAV